MSGFSEQFAHCAVTLRPKYTTNLWLNFRSTRFKLRLRVKLKFWMLDAPGSERANYHRCW